jgi:cytoskeletal protein CcmA (bactofilin family)
MIPNESTTTIGRATKVCGEISGTTDLLIDGEVDGIIRLTGARLTIRAEGRVKAKVAAQDVVIIGQIEGEVYATGRVELRNGAVVLGDIFATRLSIEDGSTFRGAVDPTRANEPIAVPSKA